MKRALLLMATTLAVTGCHTHCDYSDVAVFWHFPNPAGGELSCAQAGVASMRIIVDGVEVETVGCTVPDASGRPAQGVTLTSFFYGQPYQFELDGLDASGAIVYLDQWTYAPNACGLVTLDRTLTSLAGDLNIAYPGGCHTPAPGGYPTTFMWFTLLDQSGQPYTSVDLRNDPTAIPCGSGNNTIVVPSALFGRYTLAGIEEVELLANGQSIVWRYNCVPTAFQHATPGDVFTAPPMSTQNPGGTTSCSQIAHQ